MVISSARTDSAVSKATSKLGLVVAFVRRRADAVLGMLLGVHLIVWTSLPILLGQSLQLDVVEGLALGKEWQLGYFAANTVAVFSPDRPHVVVHGDLRLSPWLSREDLEQRGLVLAWETQEGPPLLPDNLRANFPRAELQTSLVLPRRMRYPGEPDVIGYAFVPPRP